MGHPGQLSLVKMETAADVLAAVFQSGEGNYRLAVSAAAVTAATTVESATTAPDAAAVEAATC